MIRAHLPPCWRAGWVGLALAVLVSRAGTAETRVRAAPSETKVSWQDIVQLVDRHPLVVAGNHETAAARAAVDAAGTADNPSLEGSSAYAQARGTGSSRTEWGLGLAIPLGWIAERGPRVAAAEADVARAAAESAVLRRDVVLKLHDLFWGLIQQQEHVAALGELERQTSLLLAGVTGRVQAGESRPVEALRVEVEAERIASELATARGALQAQRTQLGLWLGLPRGHSLTATADLTQLPRPMDASVVRSLARAHHPALRAAQAQVQALEAAASVERRARFPDLSLRLFTDNELDKVAYGAAVAIDLPLWNHNSGNIRRAESMLAAGRRRLEAQAMDVESALIELHASCEANVKVAARYRDRLHPRAAETARIVQRAYELGDASLFEVIDARRTFLETSTERVAAFSRAQTDCSRLALIVGETP